MPTDQADVHEPTWLRAGLRPPTWLGPIENTGVTMYLSINEFLLLSAQQLNTVGG